VLPVRGTVLGDGYRHMAVPGIPGVGF